MLKVRLGSESLLEVSSQQFDLANKLIFARSYEEAARVLDDLLATEEASANLLYHLRRIELAFLVGDDQPLRERYHSATDISPLVRDISMVFLNQFGELVASESLLRAFDTIQESYGPSAAVCYGMAMALEQMEETERAVALYQESVRLDTNWYPAYFSLSQIYYNAGDERQGDQYFYTFESLAPFNLYGNFETHKNIYIEFLSLGWFAEAESAAVALSEWWQSNRGVVPSEVEVFCLVASAHICKCRGDSEGYDRRIQAVSEFLRATQAQPVEGDTLYFLAKVLDEFQVLDRVRPDYFGIVSECEDQAVVRHTAAQFLGDGNYELARDFSRAALEGHASSTELRFIYQASTLNIEGVDVKSYLSQKDRLEALFGDPGRRMEAFAVLQALYEQFRKDGDVLNMLGDMYYASGDIDTAKLYYERMYAVDSFFPPAIAKYALFLVETQDFLQAQSVLSRSRNWSSELVWIKGRCALALEDYQEAGGHFSALVKEDPWNMPAVAGAVLGQIHESDLNLDVEGLQTLVEARRPEEIGDYLSTLISECRTRHRHDLAYHVSRLLYIYGSGDANYLTKIVDSALAYDPERGIQDLVLLLNTNFAHPELYYVIATLYKELWRLETAASWFQLALKNASNQILQTKCNLQLADCGIWQGDNVEKSKQMLLLVGEQSEDLAYHARLALAHAYLKLGALEGASDILEEFRTSDQMEPVYLRGVLAYKKGNIEVAKNIWKPLIKRNAVDTRENVIKKELFRLYFTDEKPRLVS